MLLASGDWWAGERRCLLRVAMRPACRAVRSVLSAWCTAASRAMKRGLLLRGCRPTLACPRPCRWRTSGVATSALSAAVGESSGQDSHMALLLRPAACALAQVEGCG